MKGQIGKVESLQDNSIKLSVTLQPEDIPEDINLLKWRFQDVEVRLSGGNDTITICKTEYEALTKGHIIAVPARFIDFLKTIRTVADDAIAEVEVENGREE